LKSWKRSAATSSPVLAECAVRQPLRLPGPVDSNRFPLMRLASRLVQGPADIPLVVMNVVSIAARYVERALFSPFRVEQDDSPVDRETEGFHPVAGGALQQGRLESEHLRRHEHVLRGRRHSSPPPRWHQERTQRGVLPRCAGYPPRGTRRPPRTRRGLDGATTRRDLGGCPRTALGRLA